MTVSSTPTTPLAINTIILLAYKRAGVLPVEATTSGANMSSKLSHGKTLLDLILDNLAVDGFNARQMSTYDLDIVAGTSSYTLPDTLLDVYEDAMFYSDASPDNELVCKQIGIDTWQTLTVKTSESPRPQLYTVFRTGATPVVKLWPVPTEAGTLRFKIVRLFGDSQTGTNTLDLQRYWQDAIVWLLAHYIAVDSSMPAERVAQLGGEAQMRKKLALRYSFEHTGAQAMVTYTTQWSS